VIASVTGLSPSPGEFLGRVVHDALSSFTAQIPSKRSQKSDHDLPAGLPSTKDYDRIPGVPGVAQDTLDPVAADPEPVVEPHAKIAVDPEAADSIGLSDNELLRRWLSWEFWQLLVLCSVALLVYSEIVCPLVEYFMGHTSFLVDSIIFFCQMVTFMLVAAFFSNDEAAGAKNTRALATVMAALALLNLLSAISMYFQQPEPQVQLIVDDIGDTLQPLARLLVVFLVVHGVLEESSSSWESLLVFASFMALGLAFAMGGLMKDLISYVFIRVDDYFKEGDYIYYENEIYQIKSVTWLFTLAYKTSTRSMMFIPNHKIGSGGCNNQSKDDARLVETSLPLPGYLTGEALETIVSEAWALIRGVEETGFTAMNGENYACQFDIRETSVYVESVATAVGLTEFCSVHLHMRLFGKYYYSNPPPWTRSGSEPEPEFRQTEWKMPWKYQVEWFLLEMKKIIERNNEKK
jgi:small-conductance mechanosensitive channel